MSQTTIDCAIRIKNGYMAHLHEVAISYSKTNESVLQILKKEGYIKDFSINQEGSHKIFQAALIYGARPGVTDVKILSKPGRRIYASVSELKSVQGGLGIALVSTSKGVMTDTQARKNKIGGEVLFEIW